MRYHPIPMVNRRVVAVVAICSVAVIASACKSDSESDPVCQTEFDYEDIPPGWTSPAPGALTLSGYFYPDETVRLQYFDNSGQRHEASGTPATERRSLTLTGLPSGAQHFVVEVSCNGGVNDSYKNLDATVK